MCVDGTDQYVLTSRKQVVWRHGTICLTSRHNIFDVTDNICWRHWKICLTSRTNIRWRQGHCFFNVTDTYVLTSRNKMFRRHGNYLLTSRTNICDVAEKMFWRHGTYSHTSTHHISIRLTMCVRFCAEFGLWIMCRNPFRHAELARRNRCSCTFVWHPVHVYINIGSRARL
jgi:hypothetical protein